jgi:hypothetical protein
VISDPGRALLFFNRLKGIEMQFGSSSVRTLMYCMWFPDMDNDSKLSLLDMFSFHYDSIENNDSYISKVHTNWQKSQKNFLLTIYLMLQLPSDIFLKIIRLLVPTEAILGLKGM